MAAVRGAGGQGLGVKVGDAGAGGGSRRTVLVAAGVGLQVELGQKGMIGTSVEEVGTTGFGVADGDLEGVQDFEEGVARLMDGADPHMVDSADDDEVHGDLNSVT